MNDKKRNGERGTSGWLAYAVIIWLAMQLVVTAQNFDFLFLGKNVPPSAASEIQNIYGGAQYAVTAKPAGETNRYPIFVYKNNNSRGPNFFKTTDDNQWVSFDLSGAFEIEVAMLDSNIPNGFVVKPRHDNISAARVSANTIRFTISQPGQYWVDIPGQDQHPLFLFANPAETGAPVLGAANVVEVDPGDNYTEIMSAAKALPTTQSRTLYFKPGVHYFGDATNVMKKRNFNLYIPYGAVLVGSFQDTDLTDVKFFGRGIIDGGAPHVTWPATTLGFPQPKNIADPIAEHRNITDFKGTGDRVTMDGLTILSSRGFLVNCFSRNSYYNNLKLMGWSYNTDGVGVFRGALLENSFLKVTDDCIKLGGGTARNCVIWHGHNAHVFVTRIFSITNASNSFVRDCDVLKKEVSFGGSIFAYRGELGGGNFFDYTFENIRIDTDVDRFIDFSPSSESYPSGTAGSNLEPEASTIPRTNLFNFTFKNITWNGKADRGSLFSCGFKGSIYNITFDNVVANGVALDSLSDFNAANGFVSFAGYGDIRDIKFINNGVTTTNVFPANEFGGNRINTGVGFLPAFSFDTPLPQPVVHFINPSFVSLTNNQSVNVAEDFPIKVESIYPNIAHVDLFLDGVLVRRDTTAPYEWGANVHGDDALRNVADGNHVFRAVVAAADGAVGSTSINVSVADVSSTETVMDRASWIITSNVNSGAELQNIKDGNNASRWPTRQNQKANQVLTINFTKRELIQRISLDNAASANDFPRGYKISGSNNGTTFKVIATGAGTSGATNILLSSPVTYQYIQIEQTGTAANWWSVYELNMYRPAANALLSQDAWLEYHFGDDLSDPARSTTHWGALTDFDRDGLRTLEEFAFNLDPLRSSANARALDIAKTGNQIQMRYRQWRNKTGTPGDYRANGISYKLEYSPSLLSTSWTTPSDAVSLLGNPTNNFDGTETITLGVTTNAKRGFYRMRISR